MKRSPRTGITFVVFGMLFVSIILLEFIRHSGVEIGEPGVKVELPNSIGSCHGCEVGYCQNEACMYFFQQNPTNIVHKCPKCNGEVSDVSLAEHKLLPKSTVVKKRQYIRDHGYTYNVSLVLSGAERRSIHNPRDCFRGQGFRLVNKRTLDVKISNTKKLVVMVLDASAETKTIKHKSSYTYWFVDESHSTPYIWEQVLWTTYDRIFRGIAPRWAYISIATPYIAPGSHNEAMLKEFIADLHKSLEK